jgi:hypothetical protein
MMRTWIGLVSLALSAVVASSGAVAVGVGRIVKRVVVARGGGHTCALLDDGSVKCWGENARGQLGYGDTTNRSAPTDAVVNLGSGRTAKSIAAGADFTCAILDTNGVKCWGHGESKQLGDDATVNRAAPASGVIALGAPAIEIAAALTHACALLDDGTVHCWGYDGYGQLGYGQDATASPGRSVSLGAGHHGKRIAVGGNHTCAILDDDTIKCWGSNDCGQLGYGDTNGMNAPAATSLSLGAGRTARLVAVGNAHTCAILDDGSTRCWGVNWGGQLGYGDTTLRSAPGSPVDFGARRAVKRILAGTDATCALLTSNGLVCWGANTGGVLGTGMAGDARGDNANEMGDHLPEVMP